ncbi:hypothetical protein A3Q56_06077, partial [Intoshia linei]
QYRPGKFNLSADALSRLNVVIGEDDKLKIKEVQLEDKKVSRGDYGSKVDSVYWNIRNRFRLENGVIVYRRDQKLLTLVPVGKRLELMQELHKVDLVSRKFYWPGFVNDVKFYVSCCLSCKENKDWRRKHVNELRPVVTTKINELWQLDIAGHFMRVWMGIKFEKVEPRTSKLDKNNRFWKLSTDVDPLVVEDNKLNSDTEVVPVKTVSGKRKSLDELKREFAFMKIDVVEKMCLYLTLSQFDDLRYYKQLKA